MVTHNAKPFGYIFRGSDLSGFGRSHAARGSGSAAAGKPAGGPHRGGFPTFPAGHPQTLARPPPRSSRPPTTRKAAHGFTPPPPTHANPGRLAGAPPQLLH